MNSVELSKFIYRNCEGAYYYKIPIIGTLFLRYWDKCYGKMIDPYNNKVTLCHESEPKFCGGGYYVLIALPTRNSEQIAKAVLSAFGDPERVFS